MTFFENSQFLQSAAKRPNLLLVLAALAALAVGGCGSKSVSVVPVKGKVLLGGQPLQTGSVSTTPPAGRGSRGSIEADGSFELSTFGDHDGALPGTHAVAVIAREPSIGSGPEATPGRLLVPKRYTDPTTSDLSIEVKADGDNHPVLELKND
jgi:hypothetical protein